MDNSLLNYGCKFSVIAIPENTNMFLMNMRVYDVVPHKIEPTADNEPVSIIWCAVYNIGQMVKSN
jgi:hypothetical protein